MVPDNGNRYCLPHIMGILANVCRFCRSNSYSIGFFRCMYIAIDRSMDRFVLLTLLVQSMLGRKGIYSSSSAGLYMRL